MVTCRRGVERRAGVDNSPGPWGGLTKARRASPLIPRQAISVKINPASARAARHHHPAQATIGRLQPQCETED